METTKYSTKSRDQVINFSLDHIYHISPDLPLFNFSVSSSFSLLLQWSKGGCGHAWVFVFIPILLITRLHPPTLLITCSHPLSAPTLSLAKISIALTRLFGG